MIVLYGILWVFVGIIHIVLVSYLTNGAPDPEDFEEVMAAGLFILFWPVASFVIVAIITAKIAQKFVKNDNEL